MGHRSRLCAALIDVPAHDFNKTVAFWNAAMDQPAETEADHPAYASYGEVVLGMALMVQSVGDPTPRVHLDIETDDVDAEVARLVALGATEVERVKTWVVMRDPVGTVFCVVRVQSPEAFQAHAATWS